MLKYPPSCHSHQPWSHLVCKRLLILVLPISNIGLGCLGLVVLKLLFLFVSSSGFILQLGPRCTREPPIAPEICGPGLEGCSCQESRRRVRDNQVLGKDGASLLSVVLSPAVVAAMPAHTVLGFLLHFPPL